MVSASKRRRTGKNTNGGTRRRVIHAKQTRRIVGEKASQYTRKMRGRSKRTRRNKMLSIYTIGKVKSILMSVYKYLLNGFAGFVFFALFSFFVDEFRENPHYLNISTFLWTAPLFFLFIIYISSAKGREPLLAFSRHALLGTTLSIIIYANTLILHDRSISTIVITNLFITVMFVYLYFLHKYYLL